MQELFLYSTNVFLKLHIQDTYRNGVHYAWCSESFDSGTLSKHSSGYYVPPSSNPLDIYRQLADDIRRQDKHSSKISEQRAGIVSRANRWARNGEISDDDKKDIIYLAKHGAFEVWRPQLYVVSRSLVQSRITLVPADKRAGIGNEWIISDLRRTEFDILEF